ncbi:MAG TPA: SDR family oxidoreductase [Thermoanaerobaculia bacterium]|nr:SDR family oxidoreductase [Thermoanaerobaculia bacterium]
MNTLEGKIAVVAGATRGAGRGIATALGQAGATVYCTGRSVRGKSAMKDRPESIEETAEIVTARGGRGIAVQTDHTVPEQVEALFARIREEHGRVDILVNDIWGGDDLTEWKPFTETKLENGLLMIDRAVKTHIITAYYGIPLLRERGIVVEITDGDAYYYRGQLFYDLVKTSVIRLAFAWAQETKGKGITSVAVTPGFLRSEWMLDHMGITEENWREGAKVTPEFIASETPLFVGRGVAALASDPNVHAKNGRVFASWDLGDEYGLTDADGSRPHFKRWAEENLPQFRGVMKKCDDTFYDYWTSFPFQAPS